MINVTEKINITLEDIKQFCTRIKVEFSKQLIDFYLKFNGGVPDKPIFYVYINDELVENEIYRFLPLIENESCPLYHSLMYNDLISDDYFPVALDVGGDIVCISFKGENTGKLFMRLHDVDPNYLFPVKNGDDINCFIDNLEEESIDEPLEDLEEFFKNKSLEKLVEEVKKEPIFLSRKTSDGTTCEDLCVRYNRISMLKYILSKKNICMSDLLTLAVDYRKYEMSVILLKNYNVNINETEYSCIDTLMSAVSSRRLEYVKLLVDYGADLNFNVKDAEDLADNARMFSSPEIIDYLKEIKKDDPDFLKRLESAI